MSYWLRKMCDEHYPKRNGYEDRARLWLFPLYWGKVNVYHNTYPIRREFTTSSTIFIALRLHACQTCLFIVTPRYFTSSLTWTVWLRFLFLGGTVYLRFFLVRGHSIVWQLYSVTLHMTCFRRLRAAWASSCDYHGHYIYMRSESMSRLQAS